MSTVVRKDAKRNRRNSRLLLTFLSLVVFQLEGGSGSSPLGYVYETKNNRLNINDLTIMYNVNGKQI